MTEKLFEDAPKSEGRTWLRHLTFHMLWLCVVLGFTAAYRIQKWRQQHHAADALRTLGAYVWAEDGDVVHVDFHIDFGASDDPSAHRPNLQNIGNADLIHIGALSGLQRLDLSGTAITGLGLEHLRELDQLIELALRDTAIDDIGLQNLQGLTRLRILDLTGTNVTDAGLIRLVRLPKLEELKLRNTHVTPEGLSAFADSRPKVRLIR